MRRQFVIFIALSALMACSYSGSGRTAVQNQLAQKNSSTLVVIASRDLRLTDISLALLRRTFRGEVTETKGYRLIPFNFGPDNPLRNTFDLRVLGMTRDQAGRYWVDRRIRGLGLPPRTVNSQLALRVLVARLPGAVGYLTADQLTDAVQSLRIDGKGHTDPGYPL